MDNVKSSESNIKKNRTGRRKWTLLERYLIAVCLVLFLGFISLIALHIFYRYRVPKRNICNSPACEQEAGRILKYMDSSVNPCTDFYKFACGSFVKYERITEERVLGLMESEDYILRYARDSIEEADENTGPNFVKKIKKFYNSCLNKPTDISEIIMELLNRTNLGSFPIYDEIIGERMTLEEVLAITTTFSKNRVNPLFSISNYRNNLQLYKGNSFAYWTEFMDPTDDKVREKKEKYIDLLILTQFYSTKSSYDLEDEAYSIIDFQTALANVTSKNSNESDVVIKISELEDICPEIKWKKLLNLLSYSSEISNEAENLSERNITVGNIGYIGDICQLINIWGSGIVQNVLVWDFLTRALVHLDPTFHKSLHEIYPGYYRLQSIRHHPVKWKECIRAVQSDVYFQVGLDLLVIERMNPDNIVKEVREYTNNIIAAMDRVIMKEDWVDKRTKKILSDQLNDFETMIGYSKDSRDINQVEKWLKNVTASDSFIANWLKNEKGYCSSGFCDDETMYFRRFQKPLAFGTYGGGGEIAIPLGMLVPPIFTPDIPRYLNYGAIGFLIGHEISHSFDNQRHLEWLNISDEALVIFNKRSECYVKQYSALPLDKKGTMVDGQQTIRENIADNSGIIQAFLAYKDYAKKEEEDGLPGLDYTNFQMFFIKYAQLWCEIVDSPAEVFKHDEHCPGKHRVSEPLKNFPSFSEEFNCPIGSFMNPQHKCRLWG